MIVRISMQMGSRLARFAAVVALGLAGIAPSAWAAAGSDELAPFLRALERAVVSGRPDAFAALAAPLADPLRARSFAAANMRPGATSATVRLRGRSEIQSAVAGSERLLVDVLAAHGDRAQLDRWQLDVEPAPATPGGFHIRAQDLVTRFDALHRLRLDGQTQYELRDATFRAEDFALTVIEGSAFAASGEDGIVALLVVGRLRLAFAPAPESERGQVEIFAGAPALDEPATAALVRFNPFELADHAPPLPQPRPADAAELGRAQAIFAELAPRAFALDLGDIDPSPWWLTPSAGAFLAEVRTKRLGDLTYALSPGEAEEIALFHRDRRLNIALYPSAVQLAARGPAFDEDDDADFDILDIDVDVALSPREQRLSGSARLAIEIRGDRIAALTLRLAESLVPTSIASDRHGPLLHMRMHGQRSVLVSFPGGLRRGERLTLEVQYSGTVEPQPLHGEALAMQENPLVQEYGGRPIEPYWLYSGIAYWYPQAPVTDYASATLRVTLPGDLVAVATGEPAGVTPVTGGNRFAFEAKLPVRYLSLVVSRFRSVPGERLQLPALAGGTQEVALRLAVVPRQRSRADELRAEAAAMMRFYATLAGDAPYPGLTLAITDNDLPGGHSPAHFAVLNQPLPGSPFSWRHDPVAFSHYPDFFLAHELAHQWWGNAVGWKSYHEQWLSEGMAQYSAALYAERHRRPSVFAGLLRQMRRTAEDASDAGPVWLGYRLGHLRGDSRPFRALVYNKGAMTLHMLRRWIGDPAFFAGLSRFYAECRYEKGGTEELRRAMEQVSGESLERFFQRWIFESGLPHLAVSHRAESGRVVVRIEQQQEDLFDVPLSLRLRESSGASREVLVRVSERVTELALPLGGTLRALDVNADDGALLAR